jgi:heptosyltransferase-3
LVRCLGSISRTNRNAGIRRNRRELKLSPSDDRPKRSSMKILVLRGGALGDLILILPALAGIRKGYPNAFIELWGRFPQVELAQPQYVDRVCDLNRAEAAQLFVKQERPPQIGSFDLAVSFLSDPDSTIAANLRASGIPRVVSVSPMVRGGRHASDHFAGVLEQLGVPRPESPVLIQVTKAPITQRRLAFHIGSGSDKKNWPLNCWSELIRSLAGDFDEFLLIAGEADTVRLKEFKAHYGSLRLRILHNAGLDTLASELAASLVFIGHDSGVTHLTAAIGRPTVALFGPTDPRIWRPLGSHVRVVASLDRKMQSIRARDVQRELATLLALSS